MVRKHNTRTKVRQLADELVAKGVEPTPTVIRDLLGRGSPNTIVSELRAWRLSKEHTASDSAELGLSEPSQVLALLTAVNETLLSLTSSHQSLIDRIDAVESKIAQDRLWMQSELDTAYSRYEAVQRHALLQIEAARESARALREQLESVKAEASLNEALLNKRLQEAYSKSTNSNN